MSRLQKVYDRRIILFFDKKRKRLNSDISGQSFLLLLEIKMLIIYSGLIHSFLLNQFVRSHQDRVERPQVFLLLGLIYHRH